MVYTKTLRSQERALGWRHLPLACRPLAILVDLVIDGTVFLEATA
jgi:hypothetical protein